MNKQPSNLNIKSKSRQKQKLKLNPSKSKLQPQPKKSTNFDKNNSNSSKSKQKQLKISKKIKIDQDKPDSAVSKHKQQNKQQTDQYGLYMKADLKHIINKNNAAKQKNNEILPQLLKNIEKNCKALKQIHNKQSQILEKRSCDHSNKLKKSKRISVEYKKHDQEQKMRLSFQKDKTDKYLLLQNKNRFSLQIAQGEIQKTKIQQKMKQNASRKSAENKVEQKNFVELFKLYKKSFQIEDFKIEKSNRKTNYNTNQSRNSSCHHNSYAHSRSGDYNFRGKSREQDKLNIQKIENLIKSQQKKAQVENVQADSLIYTGTLCINKQQTSELLQSDSRKFQKQLFAQSIKIDRIQESCMNQLEESDVIIHNALNSFNNLKKEEIQLKRQQKQNEQALQKDKQKQQTSQQISEQNLNQQVLQKKFQKSKFQQLKKEDQEEPQDLSLIGCQITLIENNLILQDSELVSFQM